MKTFDAISAASEALASLATNDIDIQATNNVDDVWDFTREIGKPYLTALLAPERNSFTAANCFWLKLVEQGKCAGCVGARLDDLGDEPIERFWAREFDRHFPDAGRIVSEISPSVHRELKGRVAYIGDLYLSPEFRGRLTILPHVFRLLHATISLEWAPRSSYAFMRTSDVYKGFSARYGFSVHLPNQKRWPGEAPDGRYNDEQLVMLPSQDTPAILQQPKP